MDFFQSTECSLPQCSVSQQSLLCLRSRDDRTQGSDCAVLPHVFQGFPWLPRGNRTNQGSNVHCSLGEDCLVSNARKTELIQIEAQGELSNPQKMHGLLSNSLALATCQPILGQCEKHLYFSSVEVPRPGASHFEDLPQRCR